jgi:hypothetical protein
MCQWQGSYCEQCPYRHGNATNCNRSASEARFSTCAATAATSPTTRAPARAPLCVVGTTCRRRARPSASSSTRTSRRARPTTAACGTRGTRRRGNDPSCMFSLKVTSAYPPVTTCEPRCLYKYQTRWLRHGRVLFVRPRHERLQAPLQHDAAVVPGRHRPLNAARTRARSTRSVV